MNEKIDHFKEKSKSWDMNSKRVKNAKSIANLIVNNIKLHKEMELMDFGAGTGLLSYCVAPNVKKIVAVDNSPSMLREFKNKCDEFSCIIEVLEKDLSHETIERKFDGIISSMTIHHLEDINALFSKFYDLLEESGFIAIADLDTEDGSFHNDNAGVFHHGFDRDTLKKIALDAGFKNIKFDLANIIDKPHRQFNVFLMTGEK
jgi:cyclopropane fatty-acyl-phospholipid synthase-like methyltransferase